MRFQDQVVRLTQKALDDISRAAEAVPVERHEWTPMGEVRSVLSQMQEISKSAAWLLPLIESGAVNTFEGEHAVEAPRKLALETPPTVGECIEQARESTTLLCATIASVKDADLERELHLPFGGGVVMTVADVLGLHHWNLVYHYGQINQIQLMLGDREMH